ncbi:MAG: bifunctional nuclease domain-containing protein [Bacteroidota bacterium]
MEHKIQLDVLGLFSNQHQEATFTLLLGEIAGDRKLPIVIGLSEAQSIVLAIESKQPARPAMHDLYGEAITRLGYTVKEVVITTLKDDVFFAQIVITDGTSTLVFDAKPSDAIAIGLRFKAPLYTEDALLNNEVGTLVSGSSDLPDTADETPMPPEYAQRLLREPIVLQFYPGEILKKLLSDAVASEYYEQAALIRDEIKRREQ